MKGLCSAHLGGGVCPSFGNKRLPFCRSKLALHLSIGRNADEHRSSRCSRLQAAQTRESVVAEEKESRTDASYEDAQGEHSTARATPQQSAGSVPMRSRRAIIDENAGERGPYHRKIVAAAKEGRPNDVEAVLREMATAGYQPGPRAYHGLICAYCKVQDPESALSAIRRAVVAEGLQPIPETYMVLMHALMARADKQLAYKVFQSMLSAGIDARRGWLLLCKEYFNFGFPEDAYALVQKGRLDGWYPDADLYEALITWMCTQADLVDAAEQMVRQEMKEAGVQPQTRHANPLVVAEAMTVSVHTAISGPLKEMQEGRLGVGCRPNADTYNAITQGCLWALRHDGGHAVHETLQEVKGDMIKAGLKWNKRTHSLFVDVHLLEGNTEFAMLAFEDMVKLARPGTALALLPDGVFVKLLVSLARENRPGDIVRVLTVAQDDRRLLPIQALQPIGSGDGTFITSWVPAALDSARSMRVVDGLTKKQLDDDVEVDLQEIEGVLIGPGGYAVTEDGAIISTSKLTVAQLRGELAARGLSTEGKRPELYRRVQAARSTAPREVADEVRLLEKRQRDKEVRENASMKAKVQKEREKRDVVWRVEEWRDRRLVSVEDVVETEEDGEEDDSEWDEDEQVARKSRQAVDRMYQEVGDDDDLEALRKRFQGADIQSNQPWWPRDRSVAELALQIALLVESLGNSPALGDWALVAKAAAQEQNMVVAGAVLERLPWLTQAAAELGDERLLCLEQNGINITGDNIGLVAKALL